MKDENYRKVINNARLALLGSDIGFSILVAAILKREISDVVSWIGGVAFFIIYLYLEGRSIRKFVSAISLSNDMIVVRVFKSVFNASSYIEYSINPNSVKIIFAKLYGKKDYILFERKGLRRLFLDLNAFNDKEEIVSILKDYERIYNKP